MSPPNTELALKNLRVILCLTFYSFKIYQHFVVNLSLTQDTNFSFIKIGKPSKKTSLPYLIPPITIDGEIFKNKKQEKLKCILLKNLNWYDLSRAGPCERAQPPLSEYVVLNMWYSEYVNMWYVNIWYSEYVVLMWFEFVVLSDGGN